MDELTSLELTTLRTALDALEADLRVQLSSSEEGARPVDLDEPIGRLSRMEAMQQQSMTQANRRAAQRRLQQVEAAKTRIDRECVRKRRCVSAARVCASSAEIGKPPWT
ncbi:MAG: conjugal transfer protein TraR [Deltaproteobacteria bacterium]|nr:conjugal transfer protein TraR [Deltaproteobacteria bacterium]